MEYENKYASAAKGNAALTTGIIGTAGVGLGLLGNLLGVNAGIPAVELFLLAARICL